MTDLIFNILIANEQHLKYTQQICDEMEASSKQRGTGISKRTPEQLTQKILEGKAIIAFTGQGEWAGFCYIESWENDGFVSNSGLIVDTQFRKHGVARKIKNEIFELSRIKFPNAKVFGLTTSAAVMKINSQLGYEPVIYPEITNDEKFWSGCKSCVNYNILMSKDKKNCLCTAMVFDPLTNFNAMIQSFSVTQSQSVL